MPQPETYTPGPWKMTKRKAGDKRIFIDAKGDGYALLRCEVDCDDCDTPTAIANARLIAAAPDLLAACKAITAALGDAEWGTDKHGAELLHEIIVKHHGTLRAAIAKAEGR